MLFNSFEFLVFFPIVVSLYFLIPKKYTWVLLLAASYYFYMSWNPAYIVLIVASTLIDYFAAVNMSKYDDKKKRRKYLLISLFMNLGLLFTFKYFNFFNTTIAHAIGALGLVYRPMKLNVLLPVGISFYTFQTLSYTIDVYRGVKKPERHLGIFALYVSFFPQLVAGPIERSTKLLPQMRKKNKFDFERIKDGSLLMLWGYFKKIVVADRLAILVTTVYGDLPKYKGLPLLAATAFFAFQIYCDFSGYSDIAIGAAKIMGYDLMENFKRPLFSKNMQEFWTRWHVSLSSWFRDYVYIPLGGNRVSKLRHLFNLFITAFLSGLWHGASMNFVLWGALNGIFIITSKLTWKYRVMMVKLARLKESNFFIRAFRVMLTFFLFNIGLVFVRSQNPAQALYVFKNAFNPKGLIQYQELLKLGLNSREFYFAVISILILLAVDLIERRGSWIEKLKGQNIIMRYTVYICLTLIILIFGVYGDYNPKAFFYFQF